MCQMGRSFCWLLILLTILNVSQPLCPKYCRCMGPTPNCMKCLQKYFRQWQNEQRDCICTAGYKENNNNQQCCPKNCTQCSNSKGCTKCGQHQQLIYEPRLAIFQCHCLKNFIIDSGECQCLNKYKPELFYFDPVESACHICPEGCLCSRQGCVECGSSAYRHIIDVGGITICPCKYPLKNNGSVCQMPKNCIWAGKLKCFPESNRGLSIFGTWECLFPFRQQNGQCVCSHPYSLLSLAVQSATCVCSSYTNYTSFYLNRQGQCVVCPKDCICNSNGCIFCQNRTDRMILGPTFCGCRHPSIQLNGTCQCFKNGYVNQTTGRCECRSHLDNKKYYLYNVTDVLTNATIIEKCQKCPSGCNCSQIGCFACQETAFRQIKKTNGMFTCARCVQNATMKNQKCQCNTKDGGCLCTISQFNTYNKVSNTCHLCPAGCKCNNNGCYSCQAWTLRTIQVDGSYSSCPCVQASIASNNKCVCTHIAFDNFTCGCPENYYLQEGYCHCLSRKKPTEYFHERSTGKCKKCPEGCTCSIHGCILCSGITLRQVQYGFSVERYCMCIQTSSEVDGRCQNCLNNMSYYVDGQCQACWDCASCTGAGKCLSCPFDMELSEGECICPPKPGYQMVNIDGVCRCPLGMYSIVFRQNISGFLTLNESCQPCPPECRHCSTSFLKSQISNQPVCTACPYSGYRINSPERGCPCQIGFKENFNKSPYCCHQTCKECNETGCTSCQKSTFRKLNDKQQCACINGTVSVSDKMQCVCPDGTVMNQFGCQKCPMRCLTCKYQSSLALLLCTTCPEETNRNSSQDCQCNIGYIEAEDQQLYCHLRYCEAVENPCTKCISTRYLDPSTMQCICLFGTYEDNDGLCVPCNLTGCLNCQSQLICNQCDQHFYLIGRQCYRQFPSDRYITLQHRDGIVLLFQSYDTGGYAMVECSIGSISPVQQQIISQPVLLIRQHCSVQENNILLCRLRNPQNMMENTMIILRYVMEEDSNISTSQNSLTKENVRVNLKIGMIQSYQQMEYSKSERFLPVRMLTVILMVISCCLYVHGAKHNQIMFFMQTMAMLSYVVQNYQISGFIFNLTSCLYDFGHLRLPATYIEESYGNFGNFKLDGNMFRWPTVYICFGFCFLTLLFRLAYYTIKSCRRCRDQNQELLIRSNKKIIYRLLQYFYKTLMYPMLFLSLNRIMNWNPKVIGRNHVIEEASNFVSVTTVMVYLFVTVFQCFLQNVSRLNRIENAVEYLSALAGATILSASLRKQAYLFLLIVFFCRMVCYFYFRIKMLRDFHGVEFIKLLSSLLEFITLLLLRADSVLLVVIFFYMTVGCQIVHSVCVVFVLPLESENMTCKNTEIVVNNRSTPSLEKMELMSTMKQ